ncbi:MAG TPA: hypothetical protein VGM77_05980 [Gemmatimonadales bacterium]|jgi:hypothetical protein
MKYLSILCCLVLMPMALHSQIVKDKHSFGLTISQLPPDTFPKPMRKMWKFTCYGCLGYTLAVSSDGVAANGKPAAGRLFSPVLYRIEGITRDKESGFEAVMVSPKKGRSLVIMFRAAAESTIWPILAVDSANVDSALAMTNEFLRHEMFVGPLASVPDEQQRSIMNFFRTGPGGFVTVIDFKNRKYFSTTIGTDVVYNDNRMSEPQRNATVINELLLPMVKPFAKVAANVDGTLGLRLATCVDHYSFASYGPHKQDSLVVYLSLADIRKFANADITSQALLDASTVLLNDNRVQVNLATP